MITQEDLLNTKMVLQKWGDEVISSMRDILISENKVASGKLINSLRYVITFNGQDLDIDFEMEDYGQYVDKGRKPGKFPNIGALSKWVGIRGLPKSSIYPIAKKIKEEGIEPTPFFESTIQNNQNKLIADLSEAFALDLDNFIQKRISEKF